MPGFLGDGQRGVWADKVLLGGVVGGRKIGRPVYMGLRISLGGLQVQNSLMARSRSSDVDWILYLSLALSCGAFGLGVWGSLTQGHWAPNGFGSRQQAHSRT